MTFFCLATFYVMLDAPFMAAMQVIVYAGAIMVLIVFVIMLLNLQDRDRQRCTHGVLAGSTVGVLTLFQTMLVPYRRGSYRRQGQFGQGADRQVGHTELIGKQLFTDFLLPFEVTSLLLLVAIIGAVILSKKKI